MASCQCAGAGGLSPAGAAPTKSSRRTEHRSPADHQSATCSWVTSWREMCHWPSDRLWRATRVCTAAVWKSQAGSTTANIRWAWWWFQVRAKLLSIVLWSEEAKVLTLCTSDILNSGSGTDKVTDSSQVAFIYKHRYNQRLRSSQTSITNPVLNSSSRHGKTHNIK